MHIFITLHFETDVTQAFANTGNAQCTRPQVRATTAGAQVHGHTHNPNRSIFKASHL
jgi:hypothetical protein